jgi:hypothetical protein
VVDAEFRGEAGRAALETARGWTGFTANMEYVDGIFGALAEDRRSWPEQVSLARLREADR